MLDKEFSNSGQIESLHSKAGHIDEFEGYRNPHASRIAALADACAGAMRLGNYDRLALSHSALLHDLGELVMNRNYINSNRPLTVDERTDMQRHTVIGEQEAARMGLDRSVQLLIRWHHEWWNGSGYPDALAGERIPLTARILRVADTYAALTDFRPFNTPISEHEAKRYLVEWAGIEFDPVVVKIFLSLKGLDELRSPAPL